MKKIISKDVNEKVKKIRDIVSKSTGISISKKANKHYVWMFNNSIPNKDKMFSESIDEIIENKDRFIYFIYGAIARRESDRIKSKLEDMTIQISKEPSSNTINVFKDSNKKVGELSPSDFGTAFGWDGYAAIDFFLDVLTDCNYHLERKEIERAINKT